MMRAASGTAGPRAVRTIGIVGAGVMGRGIAQIAAQAGAEILLADVRRDACDAAVAHCAEMLRRSAAKGRLDASSAEAAIKRIQATDAGNAEGYGALADCDIVIEAVAERLDVKAALLAALEAVVRPDCIIATNTSSLSVTSIAASIGTAGRVAGFHFFNPVPAMRVVEVIGGSRTEGWVLDTLDALAALMGHQPVRAADTPGFIVNHAGRGYGGEALRILGEGVADIVGIDLVMREAAGFRLGPFELFDLTGLDVSHPVMESIYHQYYEEPRFRPSPIAAQRVAAGLLGRKTGEGFYRYVDGRPEERAQIAAPRGERLPPVWISGRDPRGAQELRDLVHAEGAAVEIGDRPSRDALILVTPIGADCTTAALAEDLDAQRTIAVDCLLGLRGRRTMMTNPATETVFADAAHDLLARSGAVTRIKDSPGFIAQRILAMIVNIGCDMAQQRIASPEDIDNAVQIGLGYPKGPLSLGDALGSRRVLTILEMLENLYGDPRYRASPWLGRRARLGLSLRTKD